MIYLKNIREKQTIHIPRTEINSKVVVIKSYDEGYADGIVEGKKLQKIKLTNLTVSENGVYKREDGWNEVEVDVKPSLQSKTINVTKDVETVMADDAFDGLSKVNVNATQYGQDKRNEGYTDGYTTGKADGTEEGYQSGKQDGIEEGYQNGYNTGKEDGTEEGYAQGKTDGYTEGYEDGIAEGGKIDVDDTQVMNITANGTYTTQYTKSEDVGRDITGYFDDNTPFYGYAHLTNHIIAIGLIATKTSKVELWWRPDFNGSGSIQYVFASSSPIFGGFYLRVDGGKFSVKFGNYTKNNQLAVEDKWYHIVVSPDGLVIDGETITTLGTPTMFMAGNNMFINGDGTASNPLCANGYFGMVKIDGKTFIPTEDGFIDYATDRILTVNKKGDYDYENPTYEGNLIRTVHVNVPQNTLKTQNKILTVTKDLEVVYPDSGYNALAEVSVDATQYGQEKQNEGYTKGHLQGKTEGYENGKADGIEEGYNQGYADGKAEGGDVELIDISDAPKMEQVNPSNILVYTPSKYGADGFSKVSINVTNIYGEGYNAGKADVDEVELVELSVTPEWENRDDSNCVTYHPSIYSADGFSNVVVNISEVYNEGYRQGMTNNPSIGSKIKLSAYGLNFTDKDFEDVISWFDFNGVVNMYKMFYSCEQLTNMPLIDTSSATSMEEMFAYCTNLTSVPQLVTSNVTDMTNMFSGCGSLTTIPLLDTSKVTDMFSMFSDCTNLTSIPKLSTSKVTRMNNMFSDCTSLTTIPLLDTSNVTDMSQMFSYCTSLTSIPSLNTTKVTDMGKMFSSCSSLTSIPLLDTSSATDMSCMFQLSGIKTVPQLDTSNVTDMNSMFYKCSGLTSVPQLDTSNVTNMYWMFNECTSLTTIPLLDTSQVEKMEYMFGKCTKLTTIPQLDTSKVSKMYGMFSDCTSLTSIPSLNARNVTDGDYIFGHTTLNKLTDLGGFNHIKSNLDISLLPNLTYDSCINVLNGLYNFTGTNQTPTSLQGRLKVHQNFLNLVGDQISIATNKGWTITA